MSRQFVFKIVSEWSMRAIDVPFKTINLLSQATNRTIKTTSISTRLLSSRTSTFQSSDNLFRNISSTKHHSTDSSSSNSCITSPQHPLNPSQQTAYNRLRPVIDSFQAPIDWAVAYGSGVIHQANSSPTGEPPLTDFLISTPSPVIFHRQNLRQNPNHYPFFAKILGANVLGWMQDQLGAGIWYVTMVKIQDIEVKYGVISTERLKRDLQNWETLYVAGRLHKPVLPLQSTQFLSSSMDQNLKSALTLSLLLLPPDQPFKEIQLWEQIAGISYSGDPRMSVPGAENPEKVRNIVKGPGVLEGFREIYGNLLSEFQGLSWEGEKGIKGWEWKGEGEAMLVQPSTPDYLGSLLSTLPVNLRKGITRHFRPTIVGSLISPEVRAERATSPAKRRGDIPDEGDLGFWIKVAEQDRFREVVSNELRHIIRRPALTQSIKGILTAGFIKSVQYSYAKFRKWLKGRQQRQIDKSK